MRTKDEKRRKEEPKITSRRQAEAEEAKAEEADAEGKKKNQKDKRREGKLPLVIQSDQFLCDLQTDPMVVSRSHLNLMDIRKIE